MLYAQIKETSSNYMFQLTISSSHISTTAASLSWDPFETPISPRYIDHHKTLGGGKLWITNFKRSWCNSSKEQKGSVLRY